MRVLLVTEATSAGVGRHVVDLAHGLIDAGCEVHLAYSPLRIDAPFEAETADLRGLSRISIPMRRAPHPADLASLRRLRAYVQRQGPFDVVHAHSSKAGILVRMLARRSQAKVVYTPHCMFTMNPTLGRLAFATTRAVERGLARRTDAIIAVSPTEHEHMLDLGLGAKRSFCIPNGIRRHPWRDRVSARRELELEDCELAIGFLGRLCHQKDPLFALRAFAQHARQNPQARLVMVGDGPMEVEARAQARALGIDSAVRWLGHRAAVEVMPAFDLFAMTSHYEAMPYVLLEALAAGLPIVCTAVGGSRVAVEPGVSGYIVEERTPEAFAAVLDSLARDPALRLALAQGARERAARFSVEAMVQATLEVYRGVGTSYPADAVETEAECAAAAEIR